MKSFKLTNTMKELMLFCNNADNASYYEFCLDKDSGCLSIRLFVTQDHCILLRMDPGDPDMIAISELCWIVSSYAPSPRVTYISKYLNKYRVSMPSGHKLYYAVVDLDTAKKFLSKLKPDMKTDLQVNFRKWAF